MRRRRHRRAAPMIDLLAQLSGVGRSGDGWTARCPAHKDRHNSLSIHHREGRWLLKCHEGCEWQTIVAALGMVAADLFDVTRGARPLGSVAAVLEERREIGTVDERRPPPVDNWQSLFNPSPDGVFVGTQEPGYLIDAITTAEIGGVWIGSAPLRSA